MSNDRYIKSIEVKNLRQSVDISLKLGSGANVFYGENGSFKTTIANLVALIAHCDFKRVGFYKPDSLTVEYSDGSVIKANYEHQKLSSHWHTRYQLFLNEENLGKSRNNRSLTSNSEGWYTYCWNVEHSAYLQSGHQDEDPYVDHNFNVQYWPSFRLLVETSKDDIELIDRVITHVGFWIRDLKFPTCEGVLLEIESKYTEYLAKRNNANISALSELGNVFTDVNDTTETIDSELVRHIKQSLENKSVGKADLVKTITQSLKESQDSAGKVELNIVNSFLDDANSLLRRKKLKVGSKNDVDVDKGRLLLHFDSGKTIGIDSISKAFSSGERQLIPLLYQFYLSNPDTLLIIDEPEISLDINWQQSLGKRLAATECKQAIVFTHSAGFASRFSREERGEIFFNEIGVVAHRGIVSKPDE